MFVPRRPQSWSASASNMTFSVSSTVLMNSSRQDLSLRSGFTASRMPFFIAFSSFITVPPSLFLRSCYLEVRKILTLSSDPAGSAMMNVGSMGAELVRDYANSENTGAVRQLLWPA